MMKNIQESELISNLQNLLRCANETINDIYRGYLQKVEVALDSAEKKNKEIITILGQLYSQLDENISFNKQKCAIFYCILSHLEKLKYDHDKLINFTHLQNKNIVLFSDKATAELEELYKGTRSIYGYLNDLLFNHNPVLFRYIFKETNKYEHIPRRFAMEHEKRLQEGLCSIQASSIYSHTLAVFEDILWHLHFIANELKVFLTNDYQSFSRLLEKQD